MQFFSLFSFSPLIVTTTPGNFTTTQNYIVGATAGNWTIGSLVSTDLDGNFGTDLAVISHRAALGAQTDLHIMLATTDGAFETTSYPDNWLSGADSIISADFDRDGFQDLLAADIFANTLSVLPNTTVDGPLQFDGGDGR